MMIYDYMEKYNMDYLGCVVIIDECPYLFIIEDDNIQDGIPLQDTNEQYSIIRDNEIVIVILSIFFENDKVPATLINDQNINYMTYNIMPLHIHELKTHGFTIEDIFHLGFFDILTNNILNDFLKETTS